MFVRATLLAALAFSSLSALAQTTDNGTTTGPVKTAVVSKPSRDFVMLQFTHDRWRGADDSITINGIGRGFGGYLCYDFPIKKAPLSFAAGIGIGTSNIYFTDNQQLVLTDSGQTQAIFTGEREAYKRFKLATAYLEAPFELRYFGNRENRNKGFKAAIGFRVGTLLKATTKGVRDFQGSKVIDKESTKRYFEQYRFSATTRIGWGNVTLLGTYNLNSLFKEGEGPQVTPYAVGICITGL
jgi:hypothetical protein